MPSPAARLTAADDALRVRRRAAADAASAAARADAEAQLRQFLAEAKGWFVGGDGAWSPLTARATGVMHDVRPRAEKLVQAIQEGWVKQMLLARRRAFMQAKKGVPKLVAVAEGEGSAPRREAATPWAIGQSLVQFNGVHVLEEPAVPITEARQVARVIVPMGNGVLANHDDRTGEWHVPGGGIEAGEDPSEAAIRELIEETGLIVEIVAWLADVHDEDTCARYYKGNLVAGEIRQTDGDNGRPVRVGIAAVNELTGADRMVAERCLPGGLREAEFDPAEHPRDEHGRFVDTGGDNPSTPEGIARSFDQAAQQMQSRERALAKKLDALSPGYVIKAKRGKTYTATDIEGDRFWIRSDGKGFTSYDLDEELGKQLIPHVGGEAAYYNPTDEPTSIVMVSPNRKDKSTWEDADREYKDVFHESLASTANQLVLSLGAEARTRMGFGVWADGAEPSVVTEFTALPRPEAAEYAAAWEGLLGWQKQVGVFHVEHSPDAPDSLYEFDLPVDHHAADEVLKAEGVIYKTLVPNERGDGVHVYVLDPGTQLLGGIGKIGRQFGVRPLQVPGHARLMGDENDREKSAREFAGFIAGYERRFPGDSRYRPASRQSLRPDRRIWPEGVDPLREARRGLEADPPLYRGKRRLLGRDWGDDDLVEAVEDVVERYVPDPIRRLVGAVEFGDLGGKHARFEPEGRKLVVDPAVFEEQAYMGEVHAVPRHVHAILRGYMQAVGHRLEVDTDPAWQDAQAKEPDERDFADAAMYVLLDRGAPDLVESSAHKADYAQQWLGTILSEGDAAFDPAKHPRGKTTADSTPGSFAPVPGGGADASTPQQAWQVTKDKAMQHLSPPGALLSPPPAGKPRLQVDPERDYNGDGIADAARVGVAGMAVPDVIPRCENLTEDERRVESAFADRYERDPDGMARQFLENVLAEARKKGQAPSFETDAAKYLSPDYRDDIANRAVYNVMLHQTANAIAKRAFLQYLDEVFPTLPEQQRHILVTAGGCAAGKGYAISNVPETKELASKVGAVFDTAGEHNAVEMPWVLREAQKRNIPTTYIFLDSHPEERFDDLIKRAKDPKNGRMVDLDLFIDSYVKGAQNFNAFYQKHRADANFVFFERSNARGFGMKSGIAPQSLQLNSGQIRKNLYQRLAKEGLQPHLVRGGTVGSRVFWGMPGIHDPASYGVHLSLGA